MARGWESKSIEQQQEEAASMAETHRPPLTREQTTAEQRRRGLELSRQNVLQQLQRTTNPRHKEMLESALAELDERLKSES